MFIEEGRDYVALKTRIIRDAKNGRAAVSTTNKPNLMFFLTIWFWLLWAIKLNIYNYKRYRKTLAIESK